MLVSLVGCEPGAAMVSVDPGLYPIYQQSVVDYVNRCDPDEPTRVAVEAPPGTRVSVDGRSPRRGSFTAKVDQQVNERFTIVVSSETKTTTHHVRCLPLDFPEWSAERTGTPQAQFYVTTLIEGFAPNVPVIFDTNGVPVWWTERQPTFLHTPLHNGNLATLNIAGGMVERRLDGSVARLLNTVGATSDFHDVIRLPNRNYMLATFEIRRCNLRLWGEGRGRCIFHDFQELTPNGDVVWSWRPETDIPLRETPSKWRSVRDASGTVDPWHYNSVAWTGDGIIVSFRHMDAIYKIDYATKDVVWKLGGKVRPERLRVIGDPVFDAGGSISGQHDARLRPNGVVTLFDNGTNEGRAPRSVAYRINEGAGTATLVRRVTDAIAPNSMCCGSTRVLGDGNYVTGWGGTPWITENEPDGTQVFRLDANFIYRAIPIADGRYTRRELRVGMDAQYDDGVITAAATAPVSQAQPEQLGDLSSRLGLSEGAAPGD